MMISVSFRLMDKVRTGRLKNLKPFLVGNGHTPGSRQFNQCHIHRAASLLARPMPHSGTGVKNRFHNWNCSAPARYSQAFATKWISVSQNRKARSRLENGRLPEKSREVLPGQLPACGAPQLADNARRNLVYVFTQCGVRGKVCEAAGEADRGLRL
jgi:hypothetical protein